MIKKIIFSFFLSFFLLFFITQKTTALELTSTSNNQKNIFSQQIDKTLPEPHASLLNGILFGSKAAIPREFFTNLQKTGTLHIIALSGYNISILLAAIFALFTPIFGKRPSALIAIFSIISFVLFVGPNPPVVRAAIMGSLTLLALFTGRTKSALYLLFISAIIMVLIDPSMPESISFQPSIGSSLGIILFASPPGSTPPTLSAVFIKSLSQELSVTLSAQIFTIPLIIYHFQQLSLISPLVNIIVAWSVPILTNLGLISAIFLYIFPPLGTLLAYLTYPFTSFFIFTVNAFAALPYSQIEFNPPLFFYLVYLLIVAFFIYLKIKKIKIRLSFINKKQQKINQALLQGKILSQKPKTIIKTPPILISFSLLSLFIIIFFSVYFIAHNKGPNARVVFCDVGQGDAILITTAQNRKILIDGGPDNQVLACLSRYPQFFDKKIDVVIITHSQIDHFGGIKSVLDRYIVRYLLVTNIANDSQSYKDLINTVQKQNIQVINPIKDDKIIIDELTLTFLWPEKVFKSPDIWTDNNYPIKNNLLEGVDVNDVSIITLVSKDNFNLLLTGDISNYILDNLSESVLEKTADNKLEILKFPHHGSPTGLSTLFLYQTKPEKTIISVGKNKFGHPDEKVLKELEKINSQVLRTDKIGDIVIPL